MSSSNDGFEDYVETTVDPGPWLLLGTTIFCFGMMVVVVPVLVTRTLQQRRRKQQQSPHTATTSGTAISPHGLLPTGKKGDTDEALPVSFREILAVDNETKKIVHLAVPYTVTALTSSVFANICLILISRRIGTKPVAAYALVQVLAGLTDGILQGPIYACTTLCSQAVGAGNNVLAGSFIQLSMIFYVLLNLPVVLFWWYYMYEIILHLEWGDDTTALLAQDFIRVYIWSYVLGGLSNALWQLLEITNHQVMGTMISMAWGATNVIVIAILTAIPSVSLVHVAYAYNVTALLFIGITLYLAQRYDWLKPFNQGLFGTVSIRNPSAVSQMLQQAVPLSFGSLLSNAEWAVLTFFASHLGPAEVAAWALLGSIWDIFYAVTGGIGDAAEIRLAYLLGDNNPRGAKVSAYKSLFLGMVLASLISILYFSLQGQIPAWFTSDTTLQHMLAELVPFVGVANLTMTFGMQCWSLIGAQGKYKLATWIKFVSSWGVAMPLAALYVYVFRLDLQGLTSAVCIGYLSTGSALSYLLLSTDWPEVAKKIHAQNAASPDDDDKDQQLYAAMRFNSNAARLAARRNIRLLTLPPGQRSGLLLGNVFSKPGTYVVLLREWSPLRGQVNIGDQVLAIDGVDVSHEMASEISSRLKTAGMFERYVSFSAPPADVADEDDDEPHVDLEQIAEDESFDRNEYSMVKAGSYERGHFGLPAVI
jgi:multidrug resistance protein, MATE family